MTTSLFSVKEKIIDSQRNIVSLLTIELDLKRKELAFYIGGRSMGPTHRNIECEHDLSY